VTYTLPTATDTYDGAVPVVCVPASGTQFLRGTTKVICTAGDVAGNTATSSFFVTVGQEPAPVISGTPADQTLEATSPAGAVLAYATPTALDAWGKALPVSCTPASGSTLPLGQTKGACTATDVNGVGAVSKFTITVVDTVAPVFLGLTQKEAHATSPKGAIVYWSLPTVSDAADPAPIVKCDRASGQWYALGATNVECIASDHSGNSRTLTFIVIVEDFIAPVVTIAKPAWTTYKLNQKVTVNYTCTDLESGIASCVGTVPDGGILPTNVAGTFTFRVTAIDNFGNLIAYRVIYTVQ